MMFLAHVLTKLDENPIDFKNTYFALVVLIFLLSLLTISGWVVSTVLIKLEILQITGTPDISFLLKTVIGISIMGIFNGIWSLTGAFCLALKAPYDVITKGKK
jgi:hypothetical protein